MPCECGNADCPATGGRFFVTVRDGKRTGFLLGPYDTHAEALSHVRRGSDLADVADPRAAFYAFGTSRVLDGVDLPKAVFDA